MTPLLRKLLGMKWWLILLMYGLLIFGVFMIESAARHVDDLKPEDLAKYGSPGAVFAARQKMWILIGTAVFFVTALVDYRWVRWLTAPVFVVSLVLMAAAKASDSEVHQLAFGGLKFQPAQLGITAGVLMVAWLVQDAPRLGRWFRGSFGRLALIGFGAGLPFLMAIKMGDTGSALVWGPVGLVALLIGGVALRHITFMLLIVAGILPILYFVVLPGMGAKKKDEKDGKPVAALVESGKPEKLSSGKRAKQRIDVWLDMMAGCDVDTENEGYAPYYATMAVGKAGWKGVGWNAPLEKNSVVARGYPSKKTLHNDYIFVVIAEELGFRGSLALLVVFAALVVQCLLVAYYSRDICGRLVAAMVLTVIFAHVFENIGMCVLLLPITGIPLPFISYSGTFVVVSMFMMGLVQSVWIHRFQQPMSPALALGEDGDEE